MKKILFILPLVFLLSACGPQKKAEAPTPTPAPKLIEMAPADRPLVSLTPRDDGRMIYLKISQMPSAVSQIEYEVIYTAVDGKSEIEKGVGDTIKEITSVIERKILLGTESCTNGCKYKYDEGVTGGTLTLNFITNAGQIFSFETPFTLKTGAQITKDGQIRLPVANFSLTPKAKLAAKDFFILMENYRGGYSVYSNTSNSLVGEYPQE